MIGSEKQSIQALRESVGELRRAGLMRVGSAALRLGSTRVAVLSKEEVAVSGLSSPSSDLWGPSPGEGVQGLHASLLATLPAEASVVLCDQPAALAALGLQGITVARCVAREAFASLSAATCPDDVAALVDLIADQAATCRVVLLGRYGVVVWGQSLSQACQSLQAIDHAAQITLAARSARPSAPPLSERQVLSWQALAAELGWAQRDLGCADCNACGNGLLHGADSCGGLREQQEQQIIDAAIGAVLER